MIDEIIDNIVEISELGGYAAIIGENPSDGARSPKLWNAAFKAHGLNYRMVPLDVSKKNIVNLLVELNSDKNFMGGAIAVPYKETVAKWLNNKITPQAKSIGAVNCLFRGDDGDLFGTNTDGEASTKTYEDKFGSVKGKSVIILGLGGAGKAIAAYFSVAVENGLVTIISRRSDDEKYALKIGARWVNWTEMDFSLKNCEVLINSTSIGYGIQEGSSALSEKQIDSMQSKVVVFDIIYQPIETQLLKISKEKKYSVMNGMAMNLEQAILAFQYNNRSDLQLTRSGMEQVE